MATINEPVRLASSGFPNPGHLRAKRATVGEGERVTEHGTARQGSAYGPAMGEDGEQRHQRRGGEDLPGWVPAAARDYLAHIEDGRTIRSLAREAQVHPSTILRRVRRVEASRDDPLVDAALRNLSSGREPAPRAAPRAKADADTDREPAMSRVPTASLEERSLPFLRRLSEPGTLLAVARDMENGVILRDGPGGEPHRLGVVTRDLAEAMALREWIACDDPDARIRRYGIASAGRSLLRRAAAEAAQGLAEAPAVFQGAEDLSDQRLRHMRSLLAESPLAALARRRDGEGKAFLDREQVAAGERLREDFETAMQGSFTINWEEVLLRPPTSPPLPKAGSIGPGLRCRAWRAL